MSLEFIVTNAQLFLLVCTRIIVLLEVAPMFSAEGIPQIARIGLGLFTAVVVFPWIQEAGYEIPDTGLGYAALLIGEGLVGIIMGFMLSVVYSIFTTAGEFFSVQMGFGASEVYDPLAQIEIPILGQYFNLVALFVFISNGTYRKVFLTAVLRSFESFKVQDLIIHKDYIISVLLKSISGLFEQALILSFPVLGTLLLVSIGMGIIAKASPQMNLLMLGFPLNEMIGFMILLIVMPVLMSSFGKIIDGSFEELLRLFARAEGGGV